MNRLTYVKIFASRTEAEIAKSALAANNIDAYIEADDAGGMYPPLNDGIRLYVNKRDEKNAKKVLMK